MDYTAVVDEMREQGFSDDVINAEIDSSIASESACAVENYEDDPFTHEGWRQQDLIDLYRFER